MTTSSPPAMPVRHREVVCPFCSLACDDLEVEAAGDRLEVAAHGCPISIPAFARPLGDATPRIEGGPAGLEAALDRAADLLRGSRLPLLAGLGTDTDGARAVMALAERAGGIVDHVAATGQFANLRAMQDAGWVATTLAEARNRADLLLFVGPGIAAVAPRLFERLLRPGPRLVDPLERDLVFLGAAPPPGLAAQHLPCPPEALPFVLAALEGLVEERPVHLDTGPDLPLAELARRLREARYALIVWAAAELPGPHADLLTGRLAAITRSLNTLTRAAGLPLAGSDNIIGVNQVCTWQSGVPLRTSFASGAPDHDPWRYATGPLLAGGAVDCLLWLAGIHDREPPGRLPTILLARPGFTPARAVTVHIPIGTPGLDHAGSVYRTDGVVSLPVRQLRDTGLPTAAVVLDAIRARLA